MCDAYEGDSLPRHATRRDVVIHSVAIAAYLAVFVTAGMAFNKHAAKQKPAPAISQPVIAAPCPVPAKPAVKAFQ